MAPSLSFCMIVKNEQHHLARCLASVQPHVDELVIVDTGSTDATVAIAQQYGAHLHTFEWCDDFAAARNYALAHTHGDWILTLDADEELVVETADWKEALLRPDVLAYYLSLTDTLQPMTPLRIPRLFRNVPDLCYSGRYHEHLTYQQQLLDPRYLDDLPDLKIWHYGYEEARLLEKNIHRDIPLLERIRQQEDINLVLLLTLGNAYLRTDQLEKAQECWAEAFECILPSLLAGELPPDTTRLPALLFTLGSDALFSRQDYDTTLLLCKRGLEWFPDYPPLHHLSGYTLKELGFSLGAAAYFDECLRLGREDRYYKREPFDQCFITVWPAADLGTVYLELNRLPEAIQFFELALSFEAGYEPAQSGLAIAQQRLAQGQA